MAERATWTVDWVSLAWMWGFVLAMTLILILWVMQYRTTLKRKAAGLYPVDSWGNYVSEAARPSSLFFLVLDLRADRVRSRAHHRPSRLGADLLMASAPLPFVSYSSLTEVLAAADDWEDLYASLQTLKGHVQEYPGCQRFDVFIRAEDDGDVRIHCYTTWDTPWQLEAFLERGYTLRAHARRLRRPQRGAQPRHGEGLLMATPEKRPRDRCSAIATSARTSAIRAGRVNRAWVILAIMVVLYLAWTLIVYFFEPGLR